MQRQCPRQRTSKRRFVIQTASLLLASLAVCALAGNHGHQRDPRIFPPDSHPYGQSYAHWSADWWQWSYSLSVGDLANPTHPLFQGQVEDLDDPFTNVDLSYGQPEGPVWFLGGTIVSTGTDGVYFGIAKRKGTVPAGKALCFPILNAEQSFVESWAFPVAPYPPDTTVAELRRDAKSFVDPAENMICEIDGRSIGRLEAFRVQSPPFFVGPLPANNIFQLFGVPDEISPAPPWPPGFLAAGSAPGNFTLAVSDGTFVLLKPLPVGKHTIHFAGDVAVPGSFSFSMDITYDITVVRPRH